MTTHTSHGRDAAFWTVAALAVVCAVVLTVAGISHGMDARSLDTGLTGGVALLSGALLVVRGTRPVAVRHLRILGAALLCWGAGQVVNSLTSDGFPGVGDVIAFLAAPLGVWGLLSVPRAVPGRHPAWRLGLDSVLLGVTVALPAWHFAFAGPLTGRPLDAQAVTAVLVLIADLTVICFATLAYVRDLDRNLLIACVGAGLYTIGDLVTMRAGLLDAQPWPWWAALLWCLAWPVIAYGLLHYEPGQPDELHDPVDPDARGVIITTTASLVLLIVSLAALLVDDDTDKVALVLVMMAVVVFGGREMLNTRIRSACCAA